MVGKKPDNQQIVNQGEYLVDDLKYDEGKNVLIKPDSVFSARGQSARYYCSSRKVTRRHIFPEQSS